jgi:hypothetical protein
MACRRPAIELRLGEIEAQNIAHSEEIHLDVRAE